MNTKIKFDTDKRIICNIADENGNISTLENIYALKWSFGADDKYPIGAASFFETAERQGTAQIPAADVDLDFGNGWVFHTDIDHKIYRLSFHGSVVRGIQYIEVDASRMVEDGVPKTKVSLSFVATIGNQFTTVEFVDGEACFRIGSGSILGHIDKAVITINPDKRPSSEANILISSVFE